MYLHIVQKDIEQLSWDEFLASYRMQSAMKGPSAWDTPSLRTPGMVSFSGNVIVSVK